MRFWRARQSKDGTEHLAEGGWGVLPFPVVADRAMGSFDDQGDAAGSARPGNRRGRVGAFLRDHFWNPPSVSEADPPTLADAQGRPFVNRQHHGAGRTPEEGLLQSQFGDTRFAREIGRLVTSLGSTPGALATSLERAGVRGRPGENGTAPLSKYLRAVVGADPNVKDLRVEADVIVVDLRSWRRPTVAVPLPGAVRAFRSAFQAGCYPSLFPDDDRLTGATPAGGDQSVPIDAPRIPRKDDGESVAGNESPPVRGELAGRGD